jgi:hypothetical protein
MKNVPRNPSPNYNIIHNPVLAHSLVKMCHSCSKTRFLWLEEERFHYAISQAVPFLRISSQNIYGVSHLKEVDLASIQAR